MQPWPPWALKPSAVMSSPESWLKSGPQRRALLRDARHVGGRVLHARDVLELIEPLHGVDRHVDHRARRDVVDDDRNADRVVDRLEVLVHALLRGLVVIGGDDQHGVGAGLLGVLRKIDRLLGGVRARARDDRDPALGLIDAPLDDLIVLVVRERRALAGGSDRHQSVGALGDLPFDNVAERLFVDARRF